MTVAHLRTYTINKGMMDSWLKLFDEALIDVMDGFGMKAETVWVNDEESQFIWIRSYGDTIEELEEKEAAFYGSDWWEENMPLVRGHLAHRDIKLIKSVD